MPQSLANVLIHIISIAKLVEEIKTSSSAHAKTLDPSLAGFYWQSGYGVFSVSQSNAPQVKAYVFEQEEHHRTRSFQEEFRLFCERHEIEYDERYVWD